jgi:hypothetical protein
LGGEAVAPERDEEEFPPLGVVGFLQIKGNRDMAFDRGDVGGGSGARVWGGCSVVDAFAHLGEAAVEFGLASLEEGLTFLELLFELLEFVGRHGGGGGVREGGGLGFWRFRVLEGREDRLVL